MEPLLARKRTHFVLWRPAAPSTPPRLVIGTLAVGAAGVPPLLSGERVLPMVRAGGADDLWEIAAAACRLHEGRVYHYWFEVMDTDVYRSERAPLRVTDPAAYAVDWRLLAPVPAGYGEEARAPAAVVRFAGGILVAADPDPASPLRTFADQEDVPLRALPANNRLVIYELPAAWTRAGDLVDARHVGVGSFQDVRALIEKEAPGANFADVAALAIGRAHLAQLGVNALELLPPADTFCDRRSWGYATSNYFAPDFDLGRPLGQEAPSACGDLLALVRACHAHGIRFIYDAVMAFSNHDPYRHANFLDYHVHFDATPRDPEQQDRDGFGGDLWKYEYRVGPAYDPLSGTTTTIVPARRHMQAHMHHWMDLYHVDGYRLDSVNNVRSWDFAREFASDARARWRSRWAGAGESQARADERFLVVAEELSMPMALLGVVDALWNEKFRNRVRNAMIGRNAAGQPSFEWSVREMIDCRTLGFGDGAQAVNYVGSHDVTNRDADGTDNDRLYDFLARHGIADAAPRIRLAFACLLTAVGIPMIFAGDEFADEMDVDRDTPNVNDEKQVDPINFDRLRDDWRSALFAYVSRLVHLRTTADALAVNDTAFIHVDFEQGKRVLVWRRGRADQDPVIVIANFSDWGSDVSNPAAEYRVPTWPSMPGRVWREVTQSRVVPPAWIGREPLYPWEAKVYTVDPRA